MAKHRRLDRALVVAKAADLADAAGSVHGVTLTTLAAALDIRVPSLYNHISNLEDLHEALALYAMQELINHLRAVATIETGVAALMRVAFAYRRFAREHPGIYPLTLRAPSPENEPLQRLAQELLQMLLLILASFGVQGSDAIHTVRGLRALLHGFVSLEASGGFKMPFDLEESFNLTLKAYLLGVRHFDELRA